MRLNPLLCLGVAFAAIIVGGQCCSSYGQIAAPAKSPFDPPIRQVKLDLGPSPYYMPAQKVHNTLSCFYYQRFVVKQCDMGQKGAEWVGIVPVREGPTAKCETLKAPGEIRVEQNDWDGYFSGAIGDIVFLDAADGMNGSMRFRAVGAANGRTVFEDEAKRRYRLKNNTLVWEGQRLHIVRPPNSAPVLTYIRGYFADCSLPVSGGACWKRIRAAAGLTQTSAPVCTGYGKDYRDDPSVVFFPVRVELGAKPVATPVVGRVRCEAQD